MSGRSMQSDWTFFINITDPSKIKVQFKIFKELAAKLKYPTQFHLNFDCELYIKFKSSHCNQINKFA